MRLFLGLTVAAVLNLAACWLLCRALCVLRFRRQVANMGRCYTDRNPGSMFGDWFARKHSFARLLFSTRSLALSEWYSTEELCEIWYDPRGLAEALRESGAGLGGKEARNG